MRGALCTSHVSAAYCAYVVGEERNATVRKLFMQQECHLAQRNTFGLVHGPRLLCP